MPLAREESALPSRPEQSPPFPRLVESGPGSASADPFAAVAEQIRALPGVATVVYEGPGGAAGAAGAPSPLEEETRCLGHLARALGDAFHAGRATAGLVQASQRSVLLLAGKTGHLTILMKPDGRAEVIQAEIRKLVAAQRA